MKHIHSIAAATILLFCCTAGRAQAPAPAQPPAVITAGPYALDLANSMVQFYVNARLTNVKGIFRSFQLADVTEGSGIASLRGRILIDTASVFTREKKRDDHLRADDFFWSEKFPQAVVTVKNIVPVSGDQYQVTISLRIRDKERDFTVPTTIVKTQEGITASGEFIVDRTVYDLTGEYLANKVMDDEAQVSFRFVLLKTK